MTEQKISPLEAEVKAAAEQRYPLFNDRLDYPSAAVTHYMRGAFQSGAKWAASRPTGETFDERHAATSTGRRANERMG